jgi:prepilin-type N-terminal cleavage/methylation domain-containing protein
MSASIRLRRHSGFTLLEMIITVVVLALMVSVGYPRVARTIAHARVNSTAAVIAADFEHAFSLAGRQRKPVRIVVNKVAMSYRITDRSGTVLRERFFGGTADLHVGSMDATVTTLDVFPNGLSSGPLSVTIGIDTYTRTIAVTRVGKVRISS